MFKGTLAEAATLTLYENTKINKNSPKIICKEHYMTNSLVFYTLKKFFLLDELNKRIEMMKTGGLIDFWYFKYVGRNSKENLNPPKVLTLDNFKGSFGILLLGCVISCVVFIIELVLIKID